ncbi:MAG: hypothetical protein DVB22_000130 [Verrucomicrobia bacterium]|nr:MAG: hypothetical protein DVB22_000130 [Verrucomicrobiota bacterium]
MRVRRIAILIDGGCFIKRLSKLVAAEHRDSAAAVTTTGQTMQKGIGWRKALRAAIADNPFVKGEGLSPKARRELLGHTQMNLGLKVPIEQDI